MLGYKPRHFKMHTAVTLENLVPSNHFYRKLESKLDLRFIRERVQERYANHGRPSIDPVVFFKLQLIMFFEGIRSERQLMDVVNVNVAHRWYIGYDLDEQVPDHSALSKIRDRYGLETFQFFFEHVVEQCFAAGLVWGKELYFDGTKIQANADFDKVVPRFEFVAQQHLETLFDKVEARTAPPLSFVEQYDGQRLLSSRTHSIQERQADTHTCTTDPDATPLYSQPDHSRLGYNLHYVIDGGKARIILGALVTPACIQDNTPMLDIERWVRFRWEIDPVIAVADKKYGTLSNVVGLEQDRMQAYLGLPDHSQRHNLFTYQDFVYDAQTDRYLCPDSKWLRRSSYDRYTQSYMYRTSAKICQVCPLKARCTTSSYARIVKRSIHQDYLDRVRAYHATPAYHKAQRKRSVWIEPIFGEAKQWHNLQKFRLRGLLKVNMQALFTAAGQNIKRLLKDRTGTNPLKPDMSAVPLPVIKLAFSLTFLHQPTFLMTFSTGCSEPQQ